MYNKKLINLDSHQIQNYYYIQARYRKDENITLP